MTREWTVNVFHQYLVLPPGEERMTKQMYTYSDETTVGCEARDEWVLETEAKTKVGVVE